MTSNNGFTPFTEPEIVAGYLQPVLERLALTFSEACMRTRTTFDNRKWSDDAALAAYLIRKEVLESLRTEDLQVEEEDVEIEHKALCGLLLTLPLVHLKIRKSKDGEIPAAGSRQSMSFYNWNLLVFPQTNLPIKLAEEAPSTSQERESNSENKGENDKSEQKRKRNESQF